MVRRATTKHRGAGDRQLSNDEIVAKYENNAAMAVTRERADAIRDAVLGLENLDGQGLMAVLAGTSGSP